MCKLFVWPEDHTSASYFRICVIRYSVRQQNFIWWMGFTIDFFNRLYFGSNVVSTDGPFLCVFRSFVLLRYVLSVWCLSAIYPFLHLSLGIMSIRPNVVRPYVLSAICLSATCRSAKCLSAICPTAIHISSRAYFKNSFDNFALKLLLGNLLGINCSLPNAQIWKNIYTWKVFE